MQQFRQMYQEIGSKFEQNPDIFRPAVQSMVQSYARIRTDTHLVSAMHTFGKYAGAAKALQKRGAAAKKGAVKHLLLKGAKGIGVQPTSTARRRSNMGRGGSRLHSGRPTKSSYIPEHGYAQSQSLSASVLPIPKRKRVPAPHSLSHAVTQNRCLGKSHSTK